MLLKNHQLLIQSRPHLFIVASAPSLLFICFSIFSLLSVNSPASFTFILVFFYHIHAFTLIHHPEQTSRSSAREEQEPFSPMSHRHANGEIIQPVFVDAAASAPPGPSLLCVRVCLCELLKPARDDCNLTNINICS